MHNFYRQNGEVGQLGMQSDVLSHLRNVREQEKTYSVVSYSLTEEKKTHL